MDLFNSTEEAMQVSLIIRAVIFAFLFTFAGWFSLATNTANRTAVKVLGVVLLLAGLFNVVMAFEWIMLFYF